MKRVGFVLDRKQNEFRLALLDLLMVQRGFSYKEAEMKAREFMLKQLQVGIFTCAEEAHKEFDLCVLDHERMKKILEEQREVMV